MTPHRHRWHSTALLTLSLPDTAGRFEVLKSWACWDCAQTGTAVGVIGPEACTLSPEQWDVAARQQRRDLTPAGQVLARLWQVYEQGQQRLRTPRAGARP